MRSFLRRLWENWKGITGYIGDFQARLLLTVFYFTAAVPFGVLMRLVGDPLHVRDRPATSGWMKRQTRDTDLPAAQRQF